MDFAPLIQHLIDLFAAGLLAAATALVGYGVTWLRSKTKLVTAEHEAMVRAYVETALVKGVAYAKKEAAKVDVTIGSTGNVLVDIAAKYVIEAVPEGLAKLGITEAQVKKLVTARMEDLLS